jgi:hypothetical protein
MEDNNYASHLIEMLIFSQPKSEKVMSRGFIKFPRSLFSDPIWLNFSPDEKAIFLALVVNAAWEETTYDDFGVLVILKPGQLIMTQRELVRHVFPETEDFNVLNKYRSCVVRALDKFKKLNFSYQKTYHKKTIHTIVRKDVLEMFVPNSVPNSYQTRTLKEEYKNIRKNKYTPNSIEFELASFFLEEIKRFLPDFRKPSLQTWCKHFEAMIKTDYRAIDDIKKYISWVTTPGVWWCGKILSAEKLRKHWDTLTAQMKQKNEQVATKESNFQKVSKHFVHGNLYNAAECTLDEIVISFTRGMKHVELRFSEKGFEDQFDKMLREFNISNPLRTEKKIEAITQSF